LVIALPRSSLSLSIFNRCYNFLTAVCDSYSTFKLYFIIFYFLCWSLPTLSTHIYISAHKLKFFLIFMFSAFDMSSLTVIKNPSLLKAILYCDSMCKLFVIYFRCRYYSTLQSVFSRHLTITLAILSNAVCQNYKL